MILTLLNIYSSYLFNIFAKMRPKKNEVKNHSLKAATGTSNLADKRKSIKNKGKTTECKSVNKNNIPIVMVGEKTSLSVSPVKLATISSLHTPERKVNLFPSNSSAIASISASSSPHAYKRTPSSSQSSVVSTGGLAAFGMKPAINMRATFRDRNSKLKCCVIKGVDSYSIVFRCEPNDMQNTNGSWSEKVLTDAVRTNAPWVTELNFDNEILYWYHNNVAQKNPKGWPIRMFTIKVEEEPGELALKNLARHICQQVNHVPRNDTTLIVDDNNFFWMKQPTVWSDVVGFEAAFLAIRKTKGEPHPGFFEENESFIHTFFHLNSFDQELGRALYAPTRALHPSIQNDTQYPGFIHGFNFPELDKDDACTGSKSTSKNRRFCLQDDESGEENEDDNEYD
jgi:hypothetical protein